MKLILLQPQLRAFESARNADAIRRLLEPLAGRFEEEDMLVLPEHFYFGAGPGEYHEAVSGFARDFSCHVVGGSYHRQSDGRSVNAGEIVDPAGRILCAYEKLRPYSDERMRVEPGERLGECTIAGRRILVLICADFWFSDLFFQAEALPDLVLVPALSVTRKSSPDYSRALWRDLAVTRAYEFGVFVGVSDWAFPSELPKRFTCGVGGLADATGTDPARFYSPIPQDGVGIYELDFTKLEAFREDRRARGFFWKG